MGQLIPALFERAWQVMYPHDVMIDLRRREHMSMCMLALQVEASAVVYPLVRLYLTAVEVHLVTLLQILS